MLDKINSFIILALFSFISSASATEMDKEVEIPVAKSFWTDTTSKNFYRVGPNIEKRITQVGIEPEEVGASNTQKIRSAIFSKAREWDEDAMVALAVSYLQEENFSESLEWYQLALASSFCKTQKINPAIFNKIKLLAEATSKKLSEPNTQSKQKSQGNSLPKKISGKEKRELKYKIQSLQSLSQRMNAIVFNITGNQEQDKVRELRIENFLDRLILDERQWDKGAEAFYNLYFVMGSFDQHPINLVNTTSILLKASKQYQERTTTFLEMGKRLACHIENLCDTQEIPNKPLQDAVCGLGVFHMDGLFFEADNRKKLRAAQLFHKSGTQTGLYNLGNLYAFGNLTVDHINPQLQLEEIDRFVRAAQWFERSGTQRAYEILGDLYALGSITVDHLQANLPELTPDEILIRQANYYYRSGSSESLEKLYAIYLSCELDETGLHSASINVMNFYVNYNNWLEMVRSKRTKVNSVAVEAMLHLKKVLGNPEESIINATALLKTHDHPAKAFQHVGAACLSGAFGDDKEKNLRNAAIMFKESGSSTSLAMLATIYLNLNEFDLAEEYALQAQAMGEDVENIFRYLEKYRSSQSDSEDESDQEVEIKKIVDLKEETPQIIKPEQSETNQVAPLDNKTDIPQLLETIKSNETENSLPVKHSKKERKQSKKLGKTQRAKELIALLHNEQTKLKNRRESKTRPWSVVDIIGSPYLNNKVLVGDILHQPWGLLGSGKPEILKKTPKKLTVYSRRIDHQNRLLYVLKPETQQIVILKDKGHYKGSNFGDYNLNIVLADYLSSPLYAQKK